MLCVHLRGPRVPRYLVQHCSKRGRAFLGETHIRIHRLSQLGYPSPVSVCVKRGSFNPLENWVEQNGDVRESWCRLPVFKPGQLSCCPGTPDSAGTYTIGSPEPPAHSCIHWDFSASQSHEPINLFFLGGLFLVLFFFLEKLIDAITFPYLRLFSFLLVTIHRKIFQMKWVCGWFGLGTGAHSFIHLFGRSVLTEGLLTQFPTSWGMECNSQKIQSTRCPWSCTAWQPCAMCWVGDTSVSKTDHFLPSWAHLDLL